MTEFALIVTKETVLKKPTGQQDYDYIPSFGNLPELLEKMASFTADADGKVDKKTTSKHGRNMTDPRDKWGPKYHPIDWSQIIEVTTYTFGSIAAFTVFLRNAIGIVKDTRDILKTNAGSVDLRIGDKVITVKDGDDLEKLAQEHLKHLPSGTATAPLPAPSPSKPATAKVAAKKAPKPRRSRGKQRK